MATGPTDVELTMNELRVLARCGAERTVMVLHLFEEVAADDPQPRSAIDAAFVFAHCAGRTTLLPITAAAAHRRGGRDAFATGPLT